MESPDTSQGYQVVVALHKEGPLTSEGLAKSLVDNGIAKTADAARKAIGRALKDGRIKSSYPIRFDKTYLYYLDKHEGKKYASAIIKLLPTKPSFFRVYKTILANKGWITLGQIMKSASAVPPTAKGKCGGRAKGPEVVQQLIKLKMIREWKALPGLYICEDGFKKDSITSSMFCKWTRCDQLLMKSFADWCRSCLLMAWNSDSYRKHEFDAVDFNSCYWDLFGPTFFGPFASAEEQSKQENKDKKKHQAFIVADVQTFREYSSNDAEGFLDRIKNVLCVWKNISLVPIVLAGGYSQQAFQTLKTKGVIPLTIDAVFGTKFSKFMQLYYELIKETYGDISIEKLQESLGLSDVVEIDEALKSNIKGDLFELIIAMAYRNLGYTTILKKLVTIKSELQTYEIDVFATRLEAECLIVECKGRKSDSIEVIDELRRHFRDRCRAAADEAGLNVINAYKVVKAIFITTGKLDSDAEVYVHKTKISHGIQCCVCTRDEVLKLLGESGEPSLATLVNLYY